MKKRDDGRTAVSFRIPLELEKAFHKYCVAREDRITKSELFTQLIYDFLLMEGVDASEMEKPKATDDIYE